MLIRVRAWLVGRLIWDEEFLCSNHNDPNLGVLILYSNYCFIVIIVLLCLV